MTCSECTKDKRLLNSLLENEPFIIQNTLTIVEDDVDDTKTEYIDGGFGNDDDGDANNGDDNYDNDNDDIKW